VIRVLIVDDDIQLLRTLRINLTARGYTVLTAADGRTALRAAAELRPDVVVLDLGLPDLDGTDVIAELRTFTQVPIIVLSARTDSSDKVHALDRGADDYVTKPFGVEELTARLRAAVRRATTVAGDQDEEPLKAGDLTIDLAAKMVCRDGNQVRLTPTEWSILELLARNLSNKEIGRAMQVGEETVKWHVKNLFAKLDAGTRKQVVSRAHILGLLETV